MQSADEEAQLLARLDKDEAKMLDKAKASLTAETVARAAMCITSAILISSGRIVQAIETASDK